MERIRGFIAGVSSTLALQNKLSASKDEKNQSLFKEFNKLVYTRDLVISLVSNGT